MPGRLTSLPILLLGCESDCLQKGSMEAETGASLSTLTRMVSSCEHPEICLLEMAMLQGIGVSRPPCDESTSEAPSSTGGRAPTVPPPPP